MGTAGLEGHTTGRHPASADRAASSAELFEPLEPETDPDLPADSDSDTEHAELADEPAPPRPLPWLVRWWLRSDIPLYLASLLLTLFVSAQALQIWTANLRVPFVYSNDAAAVLAHFKTVLETGWYEQQPMLGAPFGQNYHDFPQADNLHMMVAWVFRFFTRDVGLTINLYYLLGFPLAALAAVWFLRQVGVGRTLTVVLSALYAIAPFHWEKGENHLFLAAYYPVPLALGVILWAIRGERLWGLRTVSRRPAKILALVSGRGAATVAILALIGTASSYFSVFILLLLAAAGLITLIRTGDWRRFGGSVAAGAVLVGVMLLNMLPDLLYSVRNGNNVGALVRDDSESERYALKLVQLILPAPDHQLKAFRDLRQWYDTTYPFVSERPALGFVASLGFLALLGFVLVRLGSIAVDRHRSAQLSARQLRLRETIGYLALLTVVGFLFSTLGGFETLVSFLTSSLRSWNRMSILLAAFALAAVGLGADALVRLEIRQRRWRAVHRRWLTAGVATLLLLVGVWDQSTYRAIPAYAAVEAQWNADKQWIGQLETALPDGAMIFQLAYQGYPEASSVNGVVYSDSIKPYLHSTTLRWSAGGIRGRAVDDWNQLVAAEPSPRLVADLAAAEFEGIMIDRRTYADAGVSIEKSLGAALSKTGPDLVSGNTRYAYYSLRGERDRLAAPPYTVAQVQYLKETVLQPVFLYPSNDVVIGTNAAKEALWSTKTPTATLILDNARGAAVQVKISMVLSSPTNATQVMLTSGSQTWVVNLSAAAASAITLDYAAPPGRSDFTVAPGPDSLNLDDDTEFAIANATVVDVNRPDLSGSVACPANPASTNC